ncbi:ankyrin repeat-containing protein NPR4-like [Vigna umbellata]|uniref:ankyrin repeat-containing protein NPR4-like n=1 Tax=Vigna umbellata TaxID=87088 RepID=UPI001F5F289E|nr:ankyrin repeat-containing protein NPR4-like [Vigna umbellata]
MRLKSEDDSEDMKSEDYSEDSESENDSENTKDKRSEDDNDKEISEDLRLFTMIWLEVTTLPKEQILDLITQPSSVLFDAIKSGHDSAVKLLLSQNFQIFIKDPNNGQNLGHLLVQYRHFDYFRFIDFKRKQIIGAVDIEGNTLLHMAAHLPLQFQALSGLRASIQMQKELAWFKKVEKKVPSELRSVRNKKGKRPIDVFYDEHKKLSDEIKESAKGMANSGMVVATLVATVAFAAALTVPGGKKNEWFVVFIITNAIALFSSSASILSFLSNFTSSRFAESEFVISLHPSLTFGHALLIISVATMVVAFSAACFLIFEDTSKWVSYVVASIGVFPLLLFPLFQFSFFDDLIWSRWYRPKLESAVSVSPTLYDKFVKQPLKCNNVVATQNLYSLDNQSQVVVIGMP